MIENKPTQRNDLLQPIYMQTSWIAQQMKGYKWQINPIQLSAQMVFVAGWTGTTNKLYNLCARVDETLVKSNYDALDKLSGKLEFANTLIAYFDTKSDSVDPRIEVIVSKVTDKADQLSEQKLNRYVERMKFLANSNICNQATSDAIEQAQEQIEKIIEARNESSSETNSVDGDNDDSSNIDSLFNTNTDDLTPKTIKLQKHHKKDKVETKSKETDKEIILSDNIENNNNDNIDAGPNDSENVTIKNAELLKQIDEAFDKGYQADIKEANAQKSQITHHNNEEFNYSSGDEDDFNLEKHNFKDVGEDAFFYEEGAHNEEFSLLSSSVVQQNPSDHAPRRRKEKKTDEVGNVSNSSSLSITSESKEKIAPQFNVKAFDEKMGVFGKLAKANEVLAGCNDGNFSTTIDSILVALKGQDEILGRIYFHLYKISETKIKMDPNDYNWGSKAFQSLEKVSHADRKRAVERVLMEQALALAEESFNNENDQWLSSIINLMEGLKPDTSDMPKGKANLAHLLFEEFYNVHVENNFEIIEIDDLGRNAFVGDQHSKFSVEEKRKAIEAVAKSLKETWNI